MIHRGLYVYNSEFLSDKSPIIHVRKHGNTYSNRAKKQLAVQNYKSLVLN